MAPGHSAAETTTPAQAAPDLVTARFTCSGALAGTVRIGFSSAHAAQVGAQLMGGAPANPAGPPSDDEREAALETLRQIAGHAATALSQDWKREVQLSLVAETSADWAAAHSATISLAGPHPVSLFVEADPELAAKLTAEPATEEPQRAADQPPAPPGGNLNLLLDLGLEVRLRFGQREMLLRDLVELAPGAVVELDRRVDEPVELLVGERVFARGDVVIVDGNYGLHVTEVAPERRRSTRPCAA